jgi:hypothetical protein
VGAKPSAAAAPPPLPSLDEQQQQPPSSSRVRRRRAPLDERAELTAPLDALIDALAATAATKGYVVAHAIGAGAPLELMGVDWGADCVARRLDGCNGDNRDATYVSSAPLAALNRRVQVLLLVGVNHVAAGEREGGALFFVVVVSFVCVCSAPPTRKP